MERRSNVVAMGFRGSTPLLSARLQRVFQSVTFFQKSRTVNAAFLFTQYYYLCFMDSVDLERARIVAIIKDKHAKKEREQKERLTEKQKPKKK